MQSLTAVRLMQEFALWKRQIVHCRNTATTVTNHTATTARILRIVTTYTTVTMATTVKRTPTEATAK